MNTATTIRIYATMRQPFSSETVLRLWKDALNRVAADRSTQTGILLGLALANVKIVEAQRSPTSSVDSIGFELTTSSPIVDPTDSDTQVVIMTATAVLKMMLPESTGTDSAFIVLDGTDHEGNAVHLLLTIHEQREIS